jgi:prepilin-type N-terminal cleavage/methylation domain-containing protein
MKNTSSRKAFTLIELIIVIAVIAILAGTIFVAVDPARRLQEARNAVRSSDVATILEGIKKCQVDADGTQCGDVGTMTAEESYMIGTCTTTGITARDCAGADVTDGTVDTDVDNAACFDLADAAFGATYFADVPSDPLDGTDLETGYWAYVGADNEVTVGACAPEGEGAGGTGTAPVIQLTR